MPIDLVGAVAAWLVGVLGDAGIELVKGNPDKRALKRAVKEAVDAVMAQSDPAVRPLLRRILLESFDSAPHVALDATGSIDRGLRASIEAQLEGLEGRMESVTGYSSSDLLPMSPDALAGRLADAVTGKLRQYAAARGLPELVHSLDTAEVLGRLDDIGARLGAPTVVTARRSLPRDVSSFVGRTSQLAGLTAALDGESARAGVVGIHVVDGMAGVGKTAFAVHLAHRLADRFPDGQVFLRLHAHTPGTAPLVSEDALATLLSDDGVAAGQIPADLQARADLWRSRTAGRRMLLVLDDAADSAQVRPLLPSAPETLVLITSRRRLTGLQDAGPVSLDVLAPTEAAELFAHTAARSELSPADVTVARLVELCGYLPLAIRMVGARLAHHRTWSVSDLVSELTATSGRLAALYDEDDTVAVAFDLSYRDLNPRQQLLFRRLGAHPGIETDGSSAAALLGSDVHSAARLLKDLEDRHLIDEPERGRYRMHDLIRELAQELVAADDPAEVEMAVDRLLGYYLHVAALADLHLEQFTPRRGSEACAPNEPSALVPPFDSREAARAWMETERANLRAAVEYAASRGRPPFAVALPALMQGFLQMNGPMSEAVDLNSIALGAAREAGDRVGEANAIDDLGTMQRLSGRYADAIGSHRRAFELFVGLTDLLGQANALNGLGVALRLSNRYLDAIESHRRALELYSGIGDPLGQANAMNYMGSVQYVRGQYDEAAENHRQALELYRGLGHRLGEANALNFLGAVQYAKGEHADAVDTLGQAVDVFREIGVRLGEANALNILGAVQAADGRPEAAVETLRRAMEMFEAMSDRMGQANALNYLGAASNAAGEYGQAAQSLSKARRLYRELDDRGGEVEALNRLGTAFCGQGSTAEARERHAEALSIAAEIGSPWDEAGAYEGFGETYVQEGDVERGVEYLRKADGIYREIGAAEADRTSARLEELGFPLLG